VLALPENYRGARLFQKAYCFSTNETYLYQTFEHREASNIA